MDWILELQFPLWAIAIVVILKTIVLVRVHKGMSQANRLSMAIPGLCFGAIYLILFFFPVDAELQRFFARNGLITLFGWYAVMLWRTRKQHVNAI